MGICQEKMAIWQCEVTGDAGGARNLHWSSAAEMTREASSSLYDSRYVALVAYAIAYIQIPGCLRLGLLGNAWLSRAMPSRLHRNASEDGVLMARGYCTTAPPDGQMVSFET